MSDLPSTGKELREAIATSFDRGRPDQACDALLQACRDGNMQVKRAARQFAPHVAGAMHEAAWTGARQRGMERLGVRVPDRGSLELGACAFPVVGSGSQDRFVTVRVARRLGGGEDEMPEDLACPQAREAVADALAAARATVAGGYAALKVDVSAAAQGASLGLATALAACSTLHGVALPARISATGRVTRDGRVEPVGDVEAKLALRAAARPRSRMLVPGGTAVSHPSIAVVDTLQAAWSRALSVIAHPEETLDALRTSFRGGQWSHGDWTVARDLIENPLLDDDNRLDLMSMLLCVANHVADATEAEDLRALFDSDGYALAIPSQSLARGLGACLVGALDAFDGQAMERALAALEQHESRFEPAWRVHGLGAKALAATFRGHFDDAVALRQQAVSVATNDERARCLGDLCDSLRRAGRLDEAVAVGREALGALTELQRLRPGYAQQTRPYLHLHLARAYGALGDVPGCLRILRVTTNIPDVRHRLELERHVVSQDTQACRRTHESLPEFRRNARVFVALALAARVRAGDHAAAAELARLIGAPVTTPAEALALRVPY